MHDEAYARSFERVAPNVYRRRLKSGTVRYSVQFRDTDGRQRQCRLAATSERDAIREARAILAERDGGDRVVPVAVTVRAFGTNICRSSTRSPRRDDGPSRESGRRERTGVSTSSRSLGI